MPHLTKIYNGKPLHSLIHKLLLTEYSPVCVPLKLHPTDWKNPSTETNFAIWRQMNSIYPLHLQELDYVQKPLINTEPYTSVPRPWKSGDPVREQYKRRYRKFGFLPETRWSIIQMFKDCWWYMALIMSRLLSGQFQHFYSLECTDADRTGRINMDCSPTWRYFIDEKV